MRALLRYWWDHYSALSYQRNQVEKRLHQALSEACTPNFEFNEWQRIVAFKYSFDPLSTAGSIKDIGGRFNIGSAVNPSIPVFPALYLASDRKTAIEEKYGLVDSDTQELSAPERALAATDSVSIVSVSGKLEHVLDIREPASLRGFTNLIKGFKLSPRVHKLGKTLGQGLSEIVTTTAKLDWTLHANNWRAFPRLFDVPSNSQIFGHVAYRAGIEGIVYRSTRSDGNCLVVFPHNFAHTASVVELDGPTPSEDVPSRIDKTTYMHF